MKLEISQIIVLLIKILFGFFGIVSSEIILLIAAKTVEILLQLLKKARNIYASGGFFLTNFNKNCLFTGLLDPWSYAGQSGRAHHYNIYLAVWSIWNDSN